MKNGNRQSNIIIHYSIAANVCINENNRINDRPHPKRKCDQQNIAVKLENNW